ncbi:hypothetical protein B0H14DRAFT_2601347 [Mycena olivaceomarginata]|nr:hypothetical protein B0H14DRAFT_2601347 [Mycena olivaceomarginata]
MPRMLSNSMMAGIQAVKPPSFQSNVEPNSSDLLNKTQSSDGLHAVPVTGTAVVLTGPEWERTCFTKGIHGIFNRPVDPSTAVKNAAKEPTKRDGMPVAGPHRTGTTGTVCSPTTMRPQPANRKPAPEAPRKHNTPKHLLDGSNSEAPSAAHRAIIHATQARLNAAGAIANLIKNIEDLDAVLPTTVAQGTDEGEIHHVLTTTKTLPHLPSPAALIFFSRRTRNAATQMGYMTFMYILGVLRIQCFDRDLRHKL